LKNIRLFWWNEKYFHHKSQENYGDLLGKYLVEKIADKKVVFSIPKKFSLLDFFHPIYVTVGSILAHVNHKCVVWGSGIIQKDAMIKKAKFLAVRGPQTRKRLLVLGYQVPEVYGDPALLMPWYFNPKVEKKYAFGIIPHYKDYSMVKTWFSGSDSIHVIDLMTNDVESKTIEILQCEKVISSSLHGVIVAHAYGIPAVWQKFSDNLFGDDIKYQDYMESVEIPYYQPEVVSGVLKRYDLESLFGTYTSLPSTQQLDFLRKGLMQVCPFKI
jgi:pyruvyltransferase